MDPVTNSSPGYCFIEFNTPQEAQTAKEKTHGYSLDKSHILAAYTLDEFESLMNVNEEEDEWEAPQTKPYVPGENLERWLLSQGDQLVVRYGADTEVFLWNGARQKTLEPVEKRAYWTKSYVQWSPLGTYLVTFDKQGADLSGGADTFRRLMRYHHERVSRVDFSPGEKYLVTYNYSPGQVEMRVFDVRSGRVMRGFKVRPNEFSIGGVSWGGDEYFALHNVDTISVYDTESFSLIDKKPIKVVNVVSMCWSPADPIIALFVPGGGDRPGKVALVQIPSKVELRQKNLLGVCSCEMHWQSSGEYLAVVFDRYTNSSTEKNSRYFGFELFRIKEKDIPVEALELDDKKDMVIAFAWEPKGHRFAVIHGDGTRADVSFYSMKTARVSKLATLKAKQANSLFWSPTGKFIVLAGRKGQLEFFNVDELETMATGEHLMASVIQWDPSGRYVATAVISSFLDVESGFTIWSFNGTMLCRILKEPLFELAWRPRPPEEEEIAKNLKHYSQKLSTEDGDVSMLLSEQVREKRKALQEEWEEWMTQWKSLAPLTRQQLLNGETSDEEEEETDGFGV